jgi:hypothetical protein
MLLQTGCRHRATILRLEGSTVGVISPAMGGYTGDSIPWTLSNILGVKRAFKQLQQQVKD